MRWTIPAVALVAVALVGCGSSGGTTTVIKETPTQTIERTVEAPAHSSPSASTKAHQGSPPDVVGLTLDLAEELLEEDGYRVSASNTDTSFGIVLPEHFTVCKQDDPRGSIVPVLAQKYGC